LRLSLQILQVQTIDGVEKAVKSPKQLLAFFLGMKRDLSPLIPV
jgi:hypothetical protein